MFLYHSNTNYHQSKQNNDLYAEETNGIFVVSQFRLQNVFLPLAIGKVLFRERDEAAAPGGQSADSP